MYCALRLNLARRTKRRVPTRPRQPLVAPTVLNGVWALDFMQDALYGGRPDCVRAWAAPFNPSGVVAEAASLLKSYGISSVTGDRFAGEWPRESFRAHGITYRVSEFDRSQLYLLLPVVMSGSLELLDDPKLLKELRSLGRRRGPSGRDRVDHPRAEHDDRANSVAGVVGLLATVRRPRAGFGWSSRNDDERRSSDRRPDSHQNILLGSRHKIFFEPKGERQIMPPLGTWVRRPAFALSIFLWGLTGRLEGAFRGGELPSLVRAAGLGWLVWCPHRF